MWKEVIYCLRMFMVMTLALGIIYPLAMTGFAQVAFHDNANGSLIYKEGKPVGSALIGQGFSGEQYFHGRPSAAGENGYDAAASAASNLGPTSAKLIASVEERAKAVREINGLAVDAAVPSDLVTASGSGLDPHITPQAALMQVDRIAESRQMHKDEVVKLIEKNTAYPTLGFMGDARVNVLLLNLDLDKAI